MCPSTHTLSLYHSTFLLLPTQPHALFILQPSTSSSSSDSGRRRTLFPFSRAATGTAATAAGEADTEADATKVAAEVAAIKPMKIKEIKAELEERGVEWRDLLEKNEFALRLAEARVRGTTKPPPPVEEKGKKEEEVKAAEQPRAESSSSASSPPPPSNEEPAAAAAAAAATTPKIDEAARYTKALAEVMKLKVRAWQKSRN
eukprot:evm.model.NODE_3626_length_8950_cov_31.154636.1